MNTLGRIVKFLVKAGATLLIALVVLCLLIGWPGRLFGVMPLSEYLNYSQTELALQNAAPAATEAADPAKVGLGGGFNPLNGEPTAQPTATSAVTNTQVFSYTPGGESYGKVAFDVTSPAGRQNCFRVWQATNLVDLPWTSLFCNWAQTGNLRAQWPHPTELVLSDTGDVSFELYRDYQAPEAYGQALQDGKIGLGWFVSGFNGRVCVNGSCQDLSGGGTYQLSFPQQLDGFYAVQITVTGGQVRFWQGARVTTTDNWPLP